MRKLFSLVVGGILLTGCASIRSMMITEDTALITVVGQSGSDRTKLVDKALPEAARITRKHGFRYFVILDAADASQSGVKLSPGQPIPFMFKNNGRTIFTSFYSPGATYVTPDERIQLVRPGLDITIRMYREGDVNPANQGVWNSEIIRGGQ
jgi:hypothetical protein